MFTIKKEWKEFNIGLAQLEAHMRANFPNYTGNQAHSCLELYFSEEPTEQEKADIDAHWESLDGSDYVSVSAIQTAIENLRAGIIDKSWDAMSVAERKLVVGLTPTIAELGL